VLVSTLTSIGEQAAKRACQTDLALARMTPLKRDKLLTKCQILEEQTVMQAKEANQRSEGESKEMKDSGEL